MRQAFLALGLVLSVALSARGAAAEGVAITEEARAHFAAGVNFLQDPDGARYDDAYRAFKAAYAASPSWKILGNLGIAAMKLERDGEAIEAFTKYLAEGGKDLDREERAQVERDLKTLQAGLVSVSLSFEPAGAILTDERVPVSGTSVVNRYGPVAQAQTFGLRAGHHRLTVEAEGYERLVWEFDAAPQQQVTHAFTLSRVAAGPAPVAPPPLAPAAPAPPAPVGVNGLRIASYVGFGVGAVGVGIGTLFALKAKSSYADANALCPSFPCDLTQSQADRRDGLGEDGDSAKTLATVGYVLGGVGVAAGVTLLVLSSKKESTSAAVTLAPFITPGSAGVRGSF